MSSMISITNQPKQDILVSNLKPVSMRKYKAIRDSKYSPHSSWAVWRHVNSWDRPKANMGDLSVFEESEDLSFE